MLNFVVFFLISSLTDVSIVYGTLLMMTLDTKQILSLLNKDEIQRNFLRTSVALCLVDCDRCR